MSPSGGPILFLFCHWLCKPVSYITALNVQVALYMCHLYSCIAPDVQVPVLPEDRFSIPPLEGFVSNKDAAPLGEPVL